MSKRPLPLIFKQEPGNDQQPQPQRLKFELKFEERGESSPHPLVANASAASSAPTTDQLHRAEAQLAEGRAAACVLQAGISTRDTAILAKDAEITRLHAENARLQSDVALLAPSPLADLAWLFIWGRDGVTADHSRALQLSERGMQRSCVHCKGVLSYCMYVGLGCKRNKARSLQLARDSCDAGSKYGQWALGEMHRYGWGDAAKDNRLAFALYSKAAAQHLDAAQNCMGHMHAHGLGVAREPAQALLWLRLAADQGFPAALFNLGLLCEDGDGAAAGRDEAVRWHRLAAAAGWHGAAQELRRLCP